MFRSAIEFAFGAVTTFDFKNLGTAIGRGINDFFDNSGKKSCDIHYPVGNDDCKELPFKSLYTCRRT